MIVDGRVLRSDSDSLELGFEIFENLCIINHLIFSTITKLFFHGIFFIFM